MKKRQTKLNVASEFYFTIFNYFFFITDFYLNKFSSFELKGKIQSFLNHLETAELNNIPACRKVGTRVFQKIGHYF